MKTYIYFLKANKKDFKLLTVVASQPVKATQIDNLDFLDLPETVNSEINEIVERHKMNWKLWIESAENFAQLKESVQNRGFQNISSGANPLHNSSSINNPYIVNTDKLKKKKVMLRKGN